MIRLYRQNYKRDDTCEWMVYTEEEHYMGGDTLLELFARIESGMFNNGHEKHFLGMKTFDLIIECNDVDELWDKTNLMFPEEFV